MHSQFRWVDREGDLRLCSQGYIIRCALLLYVPPLSHEHLFKMVSTRTFDLFLGAWVLLNITTTENGSLVPDSTYGTAPAGVLEYTRTGYMSTILTATTPDLRPKGLTIPAEPDQSNTSWAIIGQHALAYAGPFQFNNAFLGTNATHGQIVHGPLISSTLPSYVNTFQHRSYTFYDDAETLNLSADLGEGIVANLWWKRLARNFAYT